MLIKLDKKSILLVLALVLLSFAMSSRQFETPATGRMPRNVLTKRAVNAASLRNIEVVSVAYDPSINSYPDKSRSPYGPDVNPTYNLVEQALVDLNPEKPDNPLSNVVEEGDTVVLKPNLVGKSGFAREGCTRTPILRPLVDFAVRAGASKVIIAEGSAFPYPDSAVFGPDYSNITGLVEALQIMYPSVAITYVDLNLDDFSWVDLGKDSAFYGVYTPQQLYSQSDIRMDEDSYYYAQDCNGYDPKGYRPGLYAVANTVFQADVFINVPKMKIHSACGVTLSLKNLIGITVSSTGNTTNEVRIKDVPHWNKTDPEHAYGEVFDRQDSFENDVIWRVMADLNKIVLYAGGNGALQSVKQRKYLSVVDAVIGMEGPTAYSPPGVPRLTGAIIAGEDPVAVDVVCCRVMGFNYTVLNSIVNIGRISNYPIGNADPTAIYVTGASLNSTFGEPYVPHVNFEDSQIAPYKMRLEQNSPPEIAAVSTDPEIPTTDVEIRLIVYPQDIEVVALGVLRYNVGGIETLVKMTRSEDALVANLGFLEPDETAICDVYLQDYFFNTGWSDRISIFVQSEDHTPPTISIVSPENKAYASNNVPLIFTVDEPIHWIGYSLDSGENATIGGNTTITDISEGSHNLSVYANDTFNNMGSSVTVCFSIDTTPPSISIVSPENKTYEATDIPLTFTVDEPVVWIAYSLDGQANVAITGNSTLLGLSDGTHQVIIRAKDTAGNTGSSSPVHFTAEIKRRKAFPTEIALATVVVATIGGCILFLVYSKKFR